MSTVREDKCYFGGKMVPPEEMVCLSSACMICREGKWETTNKIFVL